MEVLYKRKTDTNCKENILKVENNKSSTLKVFLSGSTSGVICTCLLQPLDVIKTRLQNPPISIKPAAVSQSHIFQIIINIVKQENIKGLWKGTNASLMRTVPGIGLYFALLDYIKFNFFKNRILSPTESLLIGAISRSIAGATLMPLTVVKTRFESGLYNYNGVLVALKEIFQHEGVKGLTKGLVPTICRDAPYAGIYFMFYNQTKAFIPTDIYTIYPSAVHLCCAVTSSTLASFITQPPDVFKTQMQLFPRKFNGLWSVIVHIYINHGLMGYFQGILPRLLRRTFVAGISWTLYEKVIQTKQKY